MAGAEKLFTRNQLVFVFTKLYWLEDDVAVDVVVFVDIPLGVGMLVRRNTKVILNTDAEQGTLMAWLPRMVPMKCPREPPRPSPRPLH